MSCESVSIVYCISLVLVMGPFLTVRLFIIELFLLEYYLSPRIALSFSKEDVPLFLEESRLTALVIPDHLNPVKNGRI